MWWHWSVTSNQNKEDASNIHHPSRDKSGRLSSCSLALYRLPPCRQWSSFNCDLSRTSTCRESCIYSKTRGNPRNQQNSCSVALIFTPRTGVNCSCMVSNVHGTQLHDWVTLDLDEELLTCQSLLRLIPGMTSFCKKTRSSSLVFCPIAHYSRSRISILRKAINE